jgi:K+-transporting ATPase KdpF subunit
VVCHGFDGCRASKAGKTGGYTVMNILHVLYGGGAMVAALLLVYLVYALFRAEEF